MSAVRDDWQEFIRALAANGVEYMIVGGVAVGAHGHVRYTQDLDVWFRGTEENARRLIAALREFGFESIEVLPQEFCKPRAMLVVGAEPNRIELINFADGVNFDECFPRRVDIALGEVTASVIALEDLRKNKRAVGRLQDLADLENLDETSKLTCMDGSNKSLAIRDARREDTAAIYALICELADYEKLRHEVDAAAADIARDLFGANPCVFAEVAEWNGEIAGFSLWFYNYSTFRGRHGLYLEDLYVRPAFRGHGIGKALIVNLAKRCVAEGLARFQWSVLDWNKPSIEFYESLGAKMTPEWLGCRVEGEALQKLAKS